MIYYTMSQRHLRKIGGGFPMVLSSDLATEGYSHDFRIRFSPALDLSSADRWLMSLEELQTWYTLFNISIDYNNTQFRYYNGSTYKVINLDPGIYAASDLITAISNAITANGDDPLNLVWSANENTQKFVLTLNNGYKVDFTGYNIRTLFGADNTEYDTSGSMPNVAEMSNGVNTWLLHCDLLDNGIVGPYQGRVLHAFAPAVSPGQAILIQPNLTNYLVRPGSVIQDVRVWLTDQTGRALNIQNEPLTLKISFKPLVLE